MMEINFGSRLPSHFHGDPDKIASLPRVKVALIGTGKWAYEHARSYYANPYCDLVGICARNKERVDARATEFHTNGYTDIDKMLEVEKPDLVSICLADEAHFPVTKQVFEAGLPALVEKPLVIDLEEGRQLVQMAEERNLFYAIDFNHRYSEPFLRAKKLIQDGELGEIIFAHWTFRGNHDFKFAHPYCHLIETECHGIDMLLHLVGSNIESVTAEMIDKTGKDGYGTMALAFRFENGALGSILGSYDSSYAYHGSNTCEVSGNQGRVVVEDTVKKLSFSRCDDPVAQVWQSTYFDDEARYFAGTTDRHVADMIRCFREGSPPPIPARRGLEVLQICYAAIRSFEEGRRVAVSEIS